MKRRSFFVKVFFPIFLLLLLCALFLDFIPGKKENFYFETYTVQQNDTLWRIAQQCNLKQDIRKTVFIIREKNDITPVIVPGQEILVPVAEGDLE